VSPFKILYPFILAALLFPAARVTAQVNVTDSLTLVDLYNSTNGSGWTNKTNWLTAQPVATWYGITVNTNRVYTIDLRNNNLTGFLPPTIGNLTSLQSLQFDQNSIGGSIPNSIGNLIGLQYFSIIINQLTGTIPSSLGNLTSLVWLRLGDNQLSGSIPSSLGNLSSLAYMHLMNNQFSGPIPPSFGNLSNLYEMILSMNQLTGTIPASLGNLTNIHNLELDLNQLTGSIPTSIGNLPNLSTFTVDFNQLSGTIPVFTGSSNFQNLYLGYNDFTFAGMEMVAQKIVWQKMYAPQAIIPVHVSCGKLWVSVGGTPANNTYRWYNSAGTLQATIISDSTFTPAIPGNYYVEVTNSIATQLTLYSDTTTGSILKKSLNASICPGQFYTLPSGKKVNISGIFNDTLKSVSGCGDSLITTVNLVVYSSTLNNRNVTICGGQSYTLPSGTQVNLTGTYYDTLYSSLGCDSIVTILNLSVNKPVITNSNAILCQGQDYLLPSGRIVNQAGLFNDTLRNIQGCDSIISRLTLSLDASVTQVNDSLGICPGSSGISLNAGNISNTYLWSTGSVSNSIVVSSAGLYSVIVKGLNGCVANDSFHVLSLNAPVIFLNKNIVLCSGQPRTIDAGAGYKQYLWSTGNTSESISVQALGKYWVTVTDRFQCATTDTADVNQTVNPPSGFLPPDTAVCPYANFMIGPIPGFDKYSWNSGETSSSIMVSQPGIYLLTVTDNYNCVGSDTINVNPKPCTEGIFVPNAFTPNGDGLNDLLRPINLNNAPVSQFRFAIFNRWGQKIFESRNPSSGWDGRMQGTDQPAGVYVWQLEYQFPGAPLTIHSGTVILIR
jgi:gliding motility-associated-like protein